MLVHEVCMLVNRGLKYFEAKLKKKTESHKDLKWQKKLRHKYNSKVILDESHLKEKIE